MDRTFKSWLAGMTNEERSALVDAVFDLLMMEDNKEMRDVLRPQNLRAYFKMLHLDGNRRRIIASELKNLIESAKNVRLDQGE